VKKNVVIVGGGLAGLSAAIYLARAGRTVTVFEKRQFIGGRAITNLRHGYRFNLGAHAFYRTGAGSAVLRELGIPVRGSLAKPDAVAILNGQEYRLPTGIVSLITTGLLSLGGKLQVASALLHVRRYGGSRAGDRAIRTWLDERFTDERARALFEALLRLTTYSEQVAESSAALTLAQLRVGLHGALYVDEGWQKIVDALHSAAISSGVHFVSSSRIVGVQHDGAVRAVELGGLELDADRMDTQSLAFPETGPEDVDGARLPAETVLLAVDPATAAELAGDIGVSWPHSEPVTAACLDVALRSLPRPRRTFALGIDRPLYFSVHSAFAQLTPKGGALIHLVRYGASHPVEDERALDALLDEMQPGWREVLVHRRFLPSMTVSNALVRPGAPRPSPVTSVRGLYIAGDWVGSEGLLSDAALASAKAAAKAILAAE
jgi:phytoene dehydrogenase-like protein